MAKQTGNPFLDVDFSEFTDIQKFTEQFKLPGVDNEALLESQRRNLEAITAANRVALEGAQALAQRQTEIVRQTVEETTKALRELATVGAPDQRLAKQTELAKEAFETALANVRELAEMVAKSNSEAAELINQRVSESLDEIRTAIEKTASK